MQIIRKMRSGIDEQQWHSHNCPILFTFVTEGSMTLEVAANEDTEVVNEDAEVTNEDAAGMLNFDLVAGDSFVIPPGARARYRGSEDVELLEVSLPGKFETFLMEPQ